MELIKLILISGFLYIWPGMVVRSIWRHFWLQQTQADRRLFERVAREGHDPFPPADPDALWRDAFGVKSVRDTRIK